MKLVLKLKPKGSAILMSNIQTFSDPFIQPVQTATSRLFVFLISRQSSCVSDASHFHQHPDTWKDPESETD